MSPALFLAGCLALVSAALLYSALGRNRWALTLGGMIGTGLGLMAYPLLPNGPLPEPGLGTSLPLEPYLKGPDAAVRAGIANAWVAYRLPDCRETPTILAYNAEPIRPLKQHRGRLVDGAWFEHTSLYACGQILHTSGVGYVDGRAEIRHRTALPGITAVPPRTQDAILAQIGAVRWPDAEGQTCPAVVIDTRTAQEGPLDARAEAWDEIWSFRTCAGEVQRTIHFSRPTPDQIGTRMIPLPSQTPRDRTP